MNPLHEEDILKGELEPTNEGYALAKIFTTRLCKYINLEDPFYEYKTIIPCNLYGRYDRFEPGRSHAIAAIIHKIHQAKITNAKTVEVWGDGLVRREFMYAGDLANIIMKGIRNFNKLPYLMNAGLGQDYTINEYYSVVAKYFKWKGKFIHNLSKPVGMKQKLVSTKLQEQFGWTPPTSLHQGIKKTCEYYVSQYPLIKK